MNLTLFLLCLSLVTLVQCSSGSGWCYAGCDQSPSSWSHLPGSFCGGKKQSPIDIVTSKVVANSDLHNFNFVNFSSQHAIKTVINNGHTVKFNLEEGAVEVSGGGLDGSYSALQFHFHWGDTSFHPGSEHTVDGHRYPMEMHIVTLKKGLSVDEALNQPGGIAALAFFINGTDSGNSPGPWDTLTSYVTNVTDTEVNITHSLSIDQLIGNVDRTKFYRYDGSLTTPNCSEVVVWTVFHEPIEVSADLIRMFPSKAGFSHTHRPTEELNGRHVYASPATPLPPSPSWCYDSHCSYSQAKWHLLPASHCGGKRQSPVNIETKNVVKNSSLTEFKFKSFDDKHAIMYITNTGHAVKCVLKEGAAEVSGGGLGHVYSTLQFHFHWGSHDSHGSEHAMDSKRFPMEMHIVNKRKDLTLEEAIEAPDGLAVLGFFIESAHTSKSSGGSSGHQSTSSSSSSASDMTAWKKLTGYLSSIHNISSYVNVTEEISIDDLLGGVNVKDYFRYDGSLTTPSCNEAVVWTVFKDTVKMDKDLMDMFPTHAGYHDVFRSTQSLEGRTIFRSASGAPAPVLLLLLLAFLSTFLA